MYNTMSAERALHILEVLSLLQEPLLSNKKELQDFCDNVYIISHAVNNPTCLENHPDFMEKAIQIEESLVDIGQLKEREVAI